MCQGFLFIIRIRGPPVHKRFHGSRETPNGGQWPPPKGPSPSAVQCLISKC